MNERISFGHYSVEIDNPYDAKPIVDVESLADALPHGSGLDYSYSITVSKNGNLHIHTYFHNMNESGYYCGQSPVSVRLLRVTKETRHELPKKGFYQVEYAKGDIEMTIRVNNKRGLSDYLLDVFSEDLKEFYTQPYHGTALDPNGRPARFVNGEWQED